jgi:outer membrane immunogenic protein
VQIHNKLSRKTKSFKISLYLIFLSSASALAADLPLIKSAPVSALAPSWTGFYAGLNTGGGWGSGGGNSNVWSIDGLNGGITNNIANNSGSGGVIGGGQIGYNYSVTPMFLVGAEADFQGTSLGGSSSSRYGYLLNINNGNTRYIPSWVGGGASIPWFGTVRGRLGLTVMPALLVYGTGGFAYGSLANGYNTVTQTGWTAGGGIEWMFMPNWSAKAEYLYTVIEGGFGSSNWADSNARSSYYGCSQWNTVRAGVNYHFNFTPAPMVAKN